jgi:hypothetical protein
MRGRELGVGGVRTVGLWHVTLIVSESGVLSSQAVRDLRELRMDSRNQRYYGAGTASSPKNW